MIDVFKVPIRLEVDGEIASLATVRSHSHTTDIQKRINLPKNWEDYYVTLHLLSKRMYQSIIQSILLYCSTCFCSMLSVKIWSGITNNTARIIAVPKPNLRAEQCGHYTHCNFSRTGQNTSTPTSPHCKTSRYRALRFRRAHFGKKPDPSSIIDLNNGPSLNKPK